MPDDLKSMQEQVKRLKLKKEIEKLGGKIDHEKKESSNKEYKEHYESAAKKRIEELQKQKAGLGGGFRNFLRKANINAQINQQASYLKEKQKERNLNAATLRLQQQAKYLEAKNRVRELSAANKVNFDNMLPFQSKQIKMEDIFR